MTGSTSRRIALAGIAVLAALVLAPAEPASLLGAAPLAALLLTGMAPLRYWPIATASLMLPYFTYGVMRLITEPGERAAAAVFAGITFAVFLAALDSARRR